MIKRRTFLQRHTPLVRVPMRRSSSAPVKPRRYQQSPEERAARKGMKRRSGGLCETQVPDVCTGKAAVCGHRKRRTQSTKAEKWSLANILHNCPPCERHLTEYDTDPQVRSRGWTLPSSLDPERVPVWYRGELVWLRADGAVVPVMGEGVAS